MTSVLLLTMLLGHISRNTLHVLAVEHLRYELLHEDILKREYVTLSKNTLDLLDVEHLRDEFLHGAALSKNTLHLVRIRYTYSLSNTFETNSFMKLMQRIVSSSTSFSLLNDELHDLSEQTDPDRNIGPP